MDIASLPNDPAALKELLVDKASYIAQLEEQVRLLKAILHLAKSERQAKPTAKEMQYSLFDEAEAVAGEQCNRSIRPFLRRLSFLSLEVSQEDNHGSISSRGMFREGGVLV